MIRTKILFALAGLCVSFLLLVFTAVKMSSNTSETNYAFSLATNRQKIIYEEKFCKDKENIVFVYPGILPNHPLYWLKMIRDRIKLQITRDPIRRLDLFVSYADKRLSSGIILIFQDEVGLGVSTITKAEKYLQKAGLYGRENLIEEGNEKIYEKLVEKYFTHRQEIESLLISDVLDQKSKEVLQSLQNDSNSIFEVKYFDYVQAATNCEESSESAEMAEASESAELE